MILVALLIAFVSGISTGVALTILYFDYKDKMDEWDNRRMWW